MYLVSSCYASRGYPLYRIVPLLRNMCGSSGKLQFNFSVLLSRASVSAGPAFFCPKVALWCGSTRFAGGRGFADLRGGPREDEPCLLSVRNAALFSEVAIVGAASSVTLALVEIPIYFAESDVWWAYRRPGLGCVLPGHSRMRWSSGTAIVTLSLRLRAMRK